MHSKENCFAKIVHSKCFFALSLIAVLANSLILSLDSFSNTPSRARFLVKANLFFTVVFSVEMIFKLLGLGIKNYLRDEYNLFDGFLVILSIGDLILKELTENKN